MFYYLYYLLATIIYLISLPILLILTAKKRYRESIPARFFLYRNPPLDSGDIHLHSCSLGEAKSLAPLVKSFKKYKLGFTTTTSTGFEVIKSYSKNSRYLPFEIFLPLWLKRNRVLIVTEAELWYLLFATYKRRGAKCFLINARVSSKSFPKYLKFKWLYREIFKNIDIVFAQSEEDAKRLKELGARYIEVTGNIKFAVDIELKRELKSNYRPIITGASTHKGEERPILEAFIEFKKRNLDAQLILVPRHPERFKEVENLAKSLAEVNGLSFNLYLADGLKSDIVLVDTMGELIDIYAISDIVILGGAFEKIGGHNALEPAYFGCKIITGRHYFNQKEIFSAVRGIKVIEIENLLETLLNYKELESSRIEKSFDISKIVRSVESVLQQERE